MRDFPSPQPGDRLGTLINLVREKVRSIHEGHSVEAVLQALGEPDFVGPGLSGWLPHETEKQLEELRSRFIRVHRPVADCTLVYLNPYRAGLSHRIAVAAGKVIRVWEAPYVAKPAA
jgi:hypothetical protein